MPRMIPRSTPRHPRKKHLKCLALLAGVSRDTVENVLVAHAAILLDDLAAGRDARLPALGKIKIRRGVSSRAILKPSPRLVRVLQAIDGIFE